MNTNTVEETMEKQKAGKSASSNNISTKNNHDEKENWAKNIK